MITAILECLADLFADDDAFAIILGKANNTDDIVFVVLLLTS